MADTATEAEPVEVPQAPEGAGPDALLTAALAGAQAEFPLIHKGKEATVRTKGGDTYTYRYADLADVLRDVRPVLAAHGLALVQHTRREGDAGATVLVTELRHVAGGVLTSEVNLGQNPSNPQAFGGALTYLRRYEVCTLIGVAAEDDRDAQQVEPSNGNGKAPAAELPAWAKGASNDRQAAFVQALSPLLGVAGANTLGAQIAKQLGAFPDVVVGVTRAVAAAIGGQLSEGELERLAALGAQAAAEAPPVDSAGGTDPSPGDPEPEPQDGPPLVPASDDDPDLPPAGSVAAPDLAGVTDPAVAIAALKESGCICENPLGPPSEANDACPIDGHGIPF